MSWQDQNCSKSGKYKGKWVLYYKYNFHVSCWEKKKNKTQQNQNTALPYHNENSAGQALVLD